MIPNGSTPNRVYHPTRNAFDFAIYNPEKLFLRKESGGGIGELGMGVVGRQYPVLLISFDQECSLI